MNQLGHFLTAFLLHIVVWHLFIKDIFLTGRDEEMAAWNTFLKELFFD